MNEQERRAEDQLARDYSESWDDLEDVSGQFASIPRRKNRQLNLRVDDELLDSLRDTAALIGRSYHSLAREYVQRGVARDREVISQPASTRFTMKETILVLLNARGASGQDAEPIEGRTRLQKLLFLVAQQMRPEIAARFEAYDYGPFDDEIIGDVEFLADEELVDPIPLGRSAPGARRTERGRQVLDWAAHQGQAEAPEAIESYRLTRKGLEWLERFFDSDAFGNPEAKAALADQTEALKRRFGRVPLSELVDYVYQQYPEFTSRSKIRHRVAERIAAKSADDG